MSSTRLRPYILITILLLIPVSVFLYINYLELRLEEPRRAIVSLEMMLSGDYIVPRINGSLYYNKTPLFNWVIAGMFKLFNGHADWMVRVPSLLAFLLTGYFNYRFVARYFNKQVALLSTLFFLTSADIFFYETLVSGEIDLFYALLVYLQVISIYHFYRQKNYAALFVISYLFTALGFLTKGFPSFLFQGLTLMMLTFWQKDRKLLFRWQHIAGLFTLGLVLGSYFYAYSQRADVNDFIASLFSESVNKSALGQHKNRLWINTLVFPLQFLSFVLPWSLLVIFLFKKQLFREIRKNHVMVYSLLFILVNIPVYWITGSVKNRYMLMFFPFLCMLFAYVFTIRHQVWEKWRNYSNRFFLVLVLLTALATLVIRFFSIRNITHPSLLISLVLASALFATGYLFFRFKTERIYLIILYLVFLRIGFGIYYFPSYDLSSNEGYRKTMLAKQLIEKAEGQPVYLTGRPDVREVQSGLGPLVFHKAALSTPPFISYSLPYYYEVYSGRIMYYQEKTKKGNIYLVYGNEIIGTRFHNRLILPLHRFYYDRNRPELVLFRALE